MKKIKITKVKGQPNSEMEEGYWATGSCNSGPELGKTFTFWRDANILNPDGKPGLFFTSPVKAICSDYPNVGETQIITENSTYIISEINIVG